MLLRSAKYSNAVEVWNAALPKAADLSARCLLLASLCASAADDLSFNVQWRGLWLTQQVQLVLTPKAMADAAVSLATLRLATKLVLADFGDTELDLVRDSFYTRLAGFAPRSWFVALSRNLQTVTTRVDTTEKAHQAVLDHMRRLIACVPNDTELRETLAENTRSASDQIWLQLA